MNGIPQFIVGDEVGISIELIHEMNVESVYVGYVHESDDQAQVLLYDDEAPEPEPLSGGEKRTFWTPRNVIGLEHIPGVYHLDRIQVHTAARRNILFSREELEEAVASAAVTRLEVLEEPAIRPYFGTVELDR